MEGGPNFIPGINDAEEGIIQGRDAATQAAKEKMIAILSKAPTEAGDPAAETEPSRSIFVKVDNLVREALKDLELAKLIDLVLSQKDLPEAASDGDDPPILYLIRLAVLRVRPPLNVFRSSEEATDPSRQPGTFSHMVAVITNEINQNQETGGNLLERGRRALGNFARKIGNFRDRRRQYAMAEERVQSMYVQLNKLRMAAEMASDDRLGRNNVLAEMTRTESRSAVPTLEHTGETTIENVHADNEVTTAKVADKLRQQERRQKGLRGMFRRIRNTETADTQTALDLVNQTLQNARAAESMLAKVRASEATQQEFMQFLALQYPDLYTILSSQYERDGEVTSYGDWLLNTETASFNIVILTYFFGTEVAEQAQAAGETTEITSETLAEVVDNLSDAGYTKRSFMEKAKDVANHRAVEVTLAGEGRAAKIEKVELLKGQENERVRLETEAASDAHSAHIRAVMNRIGNHGEEEHVMLVINSLRRKIAAAADTAYMNAEAKNARDVILRMTTPGLVAAGLTLVLGPGGAVLAVVANKAIRVGTRNLGFLANRELPDAQAFNLVRDLAEQVVAKEGAAIMNNTRAVERALMGRVLMNNIDGRLVNIFGPLASPVDIALETTEETPAEGEATETDTEATTETPAIAEGAELFNETIRGLVDQLELADYALINDIMQNKPEQMSQLVAIYEALYYLSAFKFDQMGLDTSGVQAAHLEDARELFERINRLALRNPRLAFRLNLATRAAERDLARLRNQVQGAKLAADVVKAGLGMGAGYGIRMASGQVGAFLGNIFGGRASAQELGSAPQVNFQMELNGQQVEVSLDSRTEEMIAAGEITSQATVPPIIELQDPASGETVGFIAEHDLQAHGEGFMSYEVVFAETQPDAETFAGGVTLGFEEIGAQRFITGQGFEVTIDPDNGGFGHPLQIGKGVRLADAMGEDYMPVANLTDGQHVYVNPDNFDAGGYQTFIVYNDTGEAVGDIDLETGILVPGADGQSYSLFGRADEIVEVTDANGNIVYQIIKNGKAVNYPTAEAAQAAFEAEMRNVYGMEAVTEGYHGETLVETAAAVEFSPEEIERIEYLELLDDRIATLRTTPNALNILNADNAQNVLANSVNSESPFNSILHAVAYAQPQGVIAGFDMAEYGPVFEALVNLENPSLEQIFSSPEWEDLLNSPETQAIFSDNVVTGDEARQFADMIQGLEIDGNKVFAMPGMGQVVGNLLVQRPTAEAFLRNLFN